MASAVINFPDDTLSVTRIDMPKRYHDPLPNAFQNRPVGSG